MTTCSVDEPRIVWRNSKEFIDARVTANFEIAEQPVHMSFVPFPYDWIEATWQGDPGLSRVASVMGSDANLPLDDIPDVFVKVIDTSEEPILSAGPLYRP